MLRLAVVLYITARTLAAAAAAGHSGLETANTADAVGPSALLHDEAELRTKQILLPNQLFDAQNQHADWILEHKDERGAPLEVLTSQEIEAFSAEEAAAWKALHPGYSEGAIVDAPPPLEFPALPFAPMATRDLTASVATMVAYATLHPHHHELPGPVSGWTAEQKAAWNLLHPQQLIHSGQIHDLRTNIVDAKEFKLADEPDGTAWYEVQDQGSNLRWYLVHKDADGERLDAYSAADIENFGPLTSASWLSLRSPGSWDGVRSSRESDSQVLAKLDPDRRREIIAELIAFATIHPGPDHTELVGSPKSWTARQVHSWNIIHEHRQIGDDGHFVLDDSSHLQELENLEVVFGLRKIVLEHKTATAGIFFIVGASIVALVTAWRTASAAEDAIRHRGFTSRLGKDDSLPPADGATLEMVANMEKGEGVAYDERPPPGMPDASPPPPPAY